MESKSRENNRGEEPARQVGRVNENSDTVFAGGTDSGDSSTPVFNSGDSDTTEYRDVAWLGQRGAGAAFEDTVFNPSQTGGGAQQSDSLEEYNPLSRDPRASGGQAGYTGVAGVQPAVPGIYDPRLGYPQTVGGQSGYSGAADPQVFGTTAAGSTYPPAQEPPFAGASYPGTPAYPGHQGQPGIHLPQPGNYREPALPVEEKKSKKIPIIIGIIVVLIALVGGLVYAFVLRDPDSSATSSDSSAAASTSGSGTADPNLQGEPVAPPSEGAKGSINPTVSPTAAPTVSSNLAPPAPQVIDRFFQISSRDIGCEEKDGRFGCTMDVAGGKDSCSAGSVNYAIQGSSLVGKYCDSRFVGQKGDSIPFVSAGSYFLSSSGNYACKVVTNSSVQCWSLQSGEGFEIGGKGDYKAIKVQ